MNTLTLTFNPLTGSFGSEESPRLSQDETPSVYGRTVPNTNIPQLIKTVSKENLGNTPRSCERDRPLTAVAGSIEPPKSLGLFPRSQGMSFSDFRK